MQLNKRGLLKLLDACSQRYMRDVAVCTAYARGGPAPTIKEVRRGMIKNAIGEGLTKAGRKP